MSRTLLNLWIDVLLLLLFLAVIWCTAILRIVFPPVLQAEGWSLFGLTYQQWADLQFWLIAVFTLAIVIHVTLHWTWVCGVVGHRFVRGKKAALSDGARTLYGVGLLVLLLNALGLAIAIASLMIDGPAN